jgi:hypothetical protein
MCKIIKPCVHMDENRVCLLWNLVVDDMLCMSCEDMITHGTDNRRSIYVSDR